MPSKTKNDIIEKYLPTARLELAIFGLGDRRLIHWATQAVIKII